MDEIKVNDLVVVYRPCKYCGASNTIGRIFKVSSMGRMDNAFYLCCKTKAEEAVDFASDGDVHYTGFALWALKKIPPIEDLEGVHSQEDKPIETVSPC